MKFNKMITMLSIAVGIVAFAAPGKLQNLGPKILSPEEKAARHEKMMRNIGGLISTEGKGRIVFVVSQKRVSDVVIDKFAKGLSKQYGIRIDICRKDAFDLACAGDEKSASKANAVVFIVDDGRLPMSLIAPEGPWSVVNISAIASDNPAKDTLEQRFRKLCARATCSMLGAGASGWKGSVMLNVTSLSELDALKSLNLDPQSMVSIQQRMRALGIEAPKMVPYLKACRDGWAPAPTNDIQRAVWERVKADKERGPSRPITIAPPKK